MPFDISHLGLPSHLSLFDLSHIERMAHRVFPILPLWLRTESSIWAIYAILCAVLLCTLLSYYTTLETMLIGASRPSITRPNLGFLFAVDAFFTFLAYQILTA